MSFFGLRGLSGFFSGVFALVLLAGASVPAQSAESLRHAELKKFEEQGGSVEFLGNRLGLDGWLLITKEGSPRYAYTTKEGGLVLGMLVAEDGTVVTAEQLKAYKQRKEGGQAALEGAEKGASKAEQFYAAVENANWVSVGRKDAPYLYMFMNVGCEHCQGFWKDLQNAIKGGKIQIRLVPFGALAENREGGAALLAAEDAGKAWNAFIGGDKAVLAKDKATPEALQKVDANTKLAQDWKLQGPPFSIYRKPGAAQLVTVTGRPDNVMLVLADLMKQE